MAAEWNSRLTAPMYIPLFVLFALIAVLGGSFSRLGYARRIGVAALLALVVRLLGVTVQAVCESTPALDVLQWAVPLIPMAYAARLLLRTGRAVSQSAPLGSELKPLGA